MSLFSTADTKAQALAKLNAALPEFSVIGSYNGSGDGTKTTGSITTGTASLVVASIGTYAVGQGIYIAGAGAAGAAKVATILAISGTTITLSSNASTTVSGAVVQHDDTAAINAAIAAACNEGGGIVKLGLGYYRCNGAFDGTTNSIITFPQGMTYVGVPKQVHILGDARGFSGDNGLSFAGGCVLDFLNAPTGGGTQPFAIAAAPYVVTNDGNFSTLFNAVDVVMDRLVVFCPNDSTFGGVNMANAERASIGDYVVICTKANSADTWTENSHGAAGLFMPQTDNNVFCHVGSAHIFGWDSGLTISDHTRLQSPYIGFCRIAIVLFQSHDLCTGVVIIELCPYMIYVDASANWCPLQITIQSEQTTSGTWARSNFDILDDNNAIRGTIDYALSVGGYNSQAISVSGGSHLTTKNLTA